MAHGDHLKYQAKPKAGRQTLFRLTSYLVCDRLLLSVIGVLMIWTANKVTTKLGEDGLF